MAGRIRTRSHRFRGSAPERSLRWRRTASTSRQSARTPTRYRRISSCRATAWRCGRQRTLRAVPATRRRAARTANTTALPPAVPRGRVSRATRCATRRRIVRRLRSRAAEYRRLQTNADNGSSNRAAIVVCVYLLHAQRAQDEGVVEGDLAQVVVAARGSAVAGGHVGVEQQRTLVLLQRAQPGDILCGLPVHHLAVVERGPYQDGGIVAGLQ